MGILQNVKVIIILLLVMRIPGVFAEEIVKKNSLGGQTIVMVPDDKSYREYIKKVYDKENNLIMIEEKYGFATLKEVPYFLHITYFSKKNRDLISVERFFKLSEATKMQGVYKSLSYYLKNQLVKEITFHDPSLINVSSNEMKYKKIVIYKDGIVISEETVLE